MIKYVQFVKSGRVHYVTLNFLSKNYTRPNYAKRGQGDRETSTHLHRAYFAKECFSKTNCCNFFRDFYIRNETMNDLSGYF